MTALDDAGQRLNTARATVANLAHHSDAALVLAYAVIIELSTDPEEVEEAEVMRDQLSPVTP